MAAVITSRCPVIVVAALKHRKRLCVSPAGNHLWQCRVCFICR